jgi:hypothetical protein
MPTTNYREQDRDDPENGQQRGIHELVEEQESDPLIECPHIRKCLRGVHLRNGGPHCGHNLRNITSARYCKSHELEPDRRA